MEADLAEASTRILDAAKRRRFLAHAGPLLDDGLDVVAWRDPRGNVIPWPDRPRLLALAIARWEGEGLEPRQLRQALRYVILQQLDPVPLKTAEEMPGRQRRYESSGQGAERIYVPPPFRVTAEQQRLEAQQTAMVAWEAEHPVEIRDLDAELELEIGARPETSSADYPEWVSRRAVRRRALIRERMRLAGVPP